MRYFATALVAFALGFLSSLIYLFSSLQISGPNPAIGKALPFAIGVGTLVSFGFVWFPANLVALATDRRRNRAEYGFLLLTSAFAFIITAGWIYKARDKAQRSSAEQSTIMRLSSEAAAATNDFERFDPLLREYCAKSPRSIYPQVGYYQVVGALLANSTTPSNTLQILSDGIGDRHEFLGCIAEHPNCPERALARFSAMPSMEVYLARNPKISPELLESLARSTNQYARMSVAQNLQTSEATLNRLREDPDSQVRRIAMNRTNGTRSKRRARPLD